MSESILQEAERIINGDRAATYGDAGDSFRDIADRWTVELGEKLSEPLTAFDVAHLMVQMKLSRAKNGFHRDSYVDVAGYAGLTEKLNPATPRRTLRLTSDLRDSRWEDSDGWVFSYIGEGRWTANKGGQQLGWSYSEPVGLDSWGGFTEVLP
jgi:hypothetical protein